MCTSIIQVDVIIPTQTKYLDLIGSIGEKVVKKLENFTGDREALAYQLNLVLTEATVNAIKHACSDNQKDCVRVSIHVEENELVIKVYDHGQGFDLENIPVPNFEQPKEGGMGIFFIRSFMDSVTYTRHKNYNVLEIVKHLK
ncbi:MAG: ATP-binding protein [Methylococcaceae bacterium]|nr:ATP-binding protein [Methylococcaceae bacterium]